MTHGADAFGTTHRSSDFHERAAARTQTRCARASSLRGEANAD
jgi:hypothetical protein